MIHVVDARLIGQSIETITFRESKSKRIARGAALFRPSPQKRQKRNYIYKIFAFLSNLFVLTYPGAHLAVHVQGAVLLCQLRQQDSAVADRHAAASRQQQYRARYQKLQSREPKNVSSFFTCRLLNSFIHGATNHATNIAFNTDE